MAETLIYNLEEFDEYMNSKQESIKRAAVAAAFAIRDNARKSLVSKANSTYRTHTGDMLNLIEGIQIGKNNNGIVKIHALGTREVYDSYKTRFFVGGTVYREQTKKNGKSLKKPFMKGRILQLNTLDEELVSSGDILEKYIQNAING